MTRFTIALVATGYVLIALASGGCGRSPRLVPVSGTITVDGKPLETGSLFVAPEGGRAAAARIGPKGRFTLSTWREGDGVVPGIHRVEIKASERLDNARIRWLVPRAVRDLATTPLRLDASVATDSATISIDTQGQPADIEAVPSSEPGGGQ